MFTLEVFGAQVVQIQMQIMACTKCRLKGSVPSTGEKNCQFLKISQNYEQLRLLQEETLENTEIPHSTSALLDRQEVENNLLPPKLYSIGQDQEQIVE